MGGLWTLECPNEGVYQGKCHVAKKGNQFVLHCPKGVTKFKSPIDGSCEPGRVGAGSHSISFLPKGLTKCERDNPRVQRVLGRCIKTLEKRGDVKSAVAVCRASIKCP